MMNTHFYAWIIVLCLAFPVHVKAQDDNVSNVASAKSIEQSRPFFSWPWLGICVLAAGAAFAIGRMGGKHDGEFSRTLLDFIVAGLPDDMEIEYEFAEISSGRFKLIVRVLNKLPDGTGKLTTTEQELDWHELPNEVRADIIRSKSKNYIRSLKKHTT